MDLSTKPLYLITDGGELRQLGQLYERISRALHAANGRISYVQIREQIIASETNSQVMPASDAELADLCNDIAPLCRKFEAKLILNRRVDLCRKLVVDGVHLGVHSTNIRDARNELGSDVVIGYSAHSAAEAESALRQGADYVFISPIFKPLSKESSRQVLGLSELKKAALNCKKPVYALGGICAANVGACRAAGAAGIAAIAELILAESPELATDKLLSAWDFTNRTRRFG